MKPQTLRQFRPAHRAVPVPEITLYEGLEMSARRFPERTAVCFYGAEISYARLRAEVDALAGYLQQDCGVAKGDRVLLYAQNSVQWIVGYYAIVRADAVVLPVNPMNLTEELAHYIDDAGAKVALVGAELLDRIRPWLQPGKLQTLIAATYGDYLGATPLVDVPDVVAERPAIPAAPGIVAWADALAAARRPGPHRARPDDLAVMPYTSGTTGKPKGCIHTHRSLMTVLGVTAQLHELTQADVVLSVAPFFHVTGMQPGMNAGLYNGSTLVVMTRWDREAALTLIRELGITVWIAVPTMVVDLLASPNITADSLASLLHLTGGGATMPEPVARRLHELTGLTFIEAYGMTETAAATHSNPINRPKRQCLGVPLFNVDSRIVDQVTLREVAVGEVGEIVVHGPQVFKGYWNSPQATAESFVPIDGKAFFRTGDLARRDEDGYFFMVDRLKRMINASGYKVWPAEVEAMMYEHPDIFEACIIGSRDAKRGETVKAVVVLKKGREGRVGAADIVAWAKERMSTYKAPRIVQFADALPKSGTGKILWRQLQDEEDRRTAA
ncbi:MAG: AMP-binding protein [Proteobacteria bacterium]|nr:AMP-binding protein [Pseudomonadota bacterium]